MQTNNLGLIVLAIALVLSAVIINNGLRGNNRVEAMIGGFTPTQYIEFNKEVDDLLDK